MYSYLQSIEDGREVLVELDVNDGADDLRHASDAFVSGGGRVESCPTCCRAQSRNVPRVFSFLPVVET